MMHQQTLKKLYNYLAKLELLVPHNIIELHFVEVLSEWKISVSKVGGFCSLLI